MGEKYEILTTESNEIDVAIKHSIYIDQIESQSTRDLFFLQLHVLLKLLRIFTEQQSRLIALISNVFC